MWSPEIMFLKGYQNLKIQDLRQELRSQGYDIIAFQYSVPRIGTACFCKVLQDFKVVWSPDEESSNMK